MKALTYHGPYDVRVENVPDPTLQEADDLLLRVTATAICGSDLHIYRGKIPGMVAGDILGHEFMGVVEEVGRGVTKLKRGDRVVVPFAIACGRCFFCKKQLFASCETTNPGRGGLVLPKGIRPGAGMFGFGHLAGGYAGGQAEYVRVPRANSGPLRVPLGLPDEKVLFLSDILPTGYQAALNARIEKGSSVAIFGAGPVGYMTAACARMLGAERIIMIDHHDYRLDFAASAYGAETIHFDRQPDPARRIIAATGGRGVDASIDAVGFEARGCAVETALSRLKIQGSNGFALRQAIAATRRGGTVSVAGVYGGWIHAFMFGDAFEKGLNFAMGPTHVQRHMPELLRRIGRGDLTPDVIITHHLALDDAPRGYRLFEKKQENCRKVIMTPQGPARRPA